MRFILHSCTVLTVLILPVVTITGCTSEDFEPGPVIAGPLELDPTHDIPVTGWWSDGRTMLRLEPTGAYGIYDDLNQYHPPIEQGRWRRQNYRTLWVEPYADPPREPRRVRVDKRDGQLVLTIGDGLPLRRLPGPPRVLEDVLLGMWRADVGDLILTANGRYHFSPAAHDLDANEIISGHRGAWRLANDALRLLPDAPNIEPLNLDLVRHDDALSLQGVNASFQRVGG